ncbi:MAG TPA: indolepyruvate oxidoreductase subunit beta [Dissulfurispiraceae bacterium]|nr:indolepyruvate oxidoreductase subunit beta [Dissulfurispiraceae bacterium]
MVSTSVLFVGVGGQGIILASKIVAECAFEVGLMVKESELHGMAQRGGSVISHVRFGKEVYSPLTPRGSGDFMMATEELEALRYAYYLKPRAQVILNRRRIMPSTVNPDTNPYPEGAALKLGEAGFEVVEVDAPEIAKALGNPKVENVILVGALSRFLPFDQDVWEKVISNAVPSKTVEINLAAFLKGREIVQGGKE